MKKEIAGIILGFAGLIGAFMIGVSMESEAKIITASGVTEICFSTSNDRVLEIGTCFSNQAYPRKYINFLRGKCPEGVNIETGKLNMIICDTTNNKRLFLQRQIKDYVQEVDDACKIKNTVKAAKQAIIFENGLEE